MQLVGDQRMHAVDRDELLGDRVRGGVVVGGRPGDAAEHLAVGQPPVEGAHPLSGEAEPVGPHPDPQCGPVQDRGGPLDGVDLGDERGDDQPGLVEHLVVGPVAVVRGEHVAHGVVLAHEQRVQELQPDPPAVEPAGAAEQRRVDVDQVVRPDRDLAPAQLRAAHGVLELLGAAVDLGGVPPVGLGVDEGARHVGVRVRVAPGARQPDRVGRPVVAGRAGDLERACRVGAVAEPVAGLELQPRGGEHVEPGGGDHLRSAGEQAGADQPRVGGKDAAPGPPARCRCRGTLRPNRVPAMPMAGADRSL